MFARATMTLCVCVFVRVCVSQEHMDRDASAEPPTKIQRTMPVEEVQGS